MFFKHVIKAATDLWSIKQGEVYSLLVGTPVGALRDLFSTIRESCLTASLGIWRGLLSQNPPSTGRMLPLMYLPSLENNRIQLKDPSKSALSSPEVSKWRTHDITTMSQGEKPISFFYFIFFWDKKLILLSWLACIRNGKCTNLHPKLGKQQPWQCPISCQVYKEAYYLWKCYLSLEVQAYLCQECLQSDPEQSRLL